MRERIYNTKSINYPHYGGKGIRICPEWESFERFFADMGERPEGCTLEREKNHLDYSPSNCRWATHGEQARNTSRSIVIEFNGQTMVRKDWADLLGISAEALKGRLKRWPKELAMTAPKGHQHLPPGVPLGYKQSSDTTKGSE